MLCNQINKKKQEKSLKGSEQHKKRRWSALKQVRAHVIHHQLVGHNAARDGHPAVTKAPSSEYPCHTPRKNSLPEDNTT